MEGADERRGGMRREGKDRVGDVKGWRQWEDVTSGRGCEERECKIIISPDRK